EADGRGRGHARGVGGRVRTSAGAGGGPPRRGAPARRVRAHGSAQPVGPAGRGPSHRGRDARITEDPAPPARTGRGRQGRRRGGDPRLGIGRGRVLGPRRDARGADSRPRGRASSIRRAVKTLLRSSFALAGAVVVAVVAAGCSSVRPPALTVNGSDISRDSVDSELAAIADNPDLKEQISGTDGTIKWGGSSICLTQVVTQQAVARGVRRRRIAARAAARRGGQAKAANFFGQRAFVAFPKWSRDQPPGEFARRQALFRAT